jgi:prepilin-type processing-associated H-X9-DG protein
MYVDDSNQIVPWPRYQAYASPAQQDNPQWTEIYGFHFNLNPPKGDDVWFNALPSYVANKPLYQWALTPDQFANSKSIYICPTAASQGISPEDVQGGNGTKTMNAGIRPLFNCAMNSKPLANESISAGNPILKTTMIVHPSAFVLFSDVRNRSAENPYFAASGNQYPNGNSIVLATPHCYTTRFSSRHNQGGVITFGDGHATYYKYKYVVADGVEQAADGSGVVPTAGHDLGQADINWDANGQRVP